MKTLLVSIALLFAAASQAMGATTVPEDWGSDALICWSLDDFTDPVTRGETPAECTCDGLKYISVPGLTLGNDTPGNNGNVMPDCYLHTTIIPGFYHASRGGDFNLLPVSVPIFVEIRGCDTSDCYWFFGSASCVIESTHQAGFRISFEINGPCSFIPE